MQEQAPKILLVDDDHFLLDMYSVKFTQSGFFVQACSSVKEAIDLVKGGYIPDAFIFDLIMPERDGFSLLETLRAGHLAPNAVRIALTNQSNDDERARAEELGADKFIIKASMIPSEVVAAVKDALKTGPKKHTKS